MKSYRIKKKEHLKSSVFAAALVDDPAIETNFVYLNKEAEPIKLAVEEERRMVYSPALIPDQKILRRDSNGDEYTIEFGKEVIEELARDYLKAGDIVGNWNSEHNEFQKLKGVTVVESWIIKDAEAGDHVKLGFTNLPEGTWMLGVHVESDATWNDVKLGKYKGISLELDVDKELINLSNPNNQNAKIMSETKGLFDQIMTKLNSIGKTKLGSVVTDTDVTIYFEGENPTIGEPLYVNEEMTEVAPTGEHTLKNGQVVIVAEGGILEEVREAAAEEDLSADKLEVIAKGIDALIEKTEANAKEIEAVKEANTELSKTVEKLTAESKENTEKLAKVKAIKGEPVHKVSEPNEIKLNHFDSLMKRTQTFSKNN